MTVNLKKLADIIIGPVISEKSTVSAEKNQQIVFRVVPNASKYEIRLAIENLFNVEVDKVRTANVAGKIKRFGKNLGKRSNWKKAYVKLKDGSDIQFAAQ